MAERGVGILLSDVLTVHIHLVLAVLELFGRKLVRVTNSWVIELSLDFSCLFFFLCKHSSVQKLCT